MPSSLFSPFNYFQNESKCRSSQESNLTFNYITFYIMSGGKEGNKEMRLLRSLAFFFLQMHDSGHYGCQQCGNDNLNCLLSRT